MFHFRKLSIIIPRYFTESADFKEVQLQIVLVQYKQFESCILIQSWTLNILTLEIEKGIQVVLLKCISSEFAINHFLLSDIILVALENKLDLSRSLIIGVVSSAKQKI
jgi:hypothetical protein